MAIVFRYCGWLNVAYLYAYNPGVPNTVNTMTRVSQGIRGKKISPRKRQQQTNGRQNIAMQWNYTTPSETRNMHEIFISIFIP